MSSSAYWKKRFELLEQSQNQLGVQCYADIERQYRQTQKQIEGQLSAWYQRFAKNNGVTIQEARKMLTSKELEEFKWDVHEYIRYGQENAINGAWCKQLENASARFHISRLEALKIHTQQSLEVMFGNQLDSIDSAMRGIYTSGYYHTAFEIQKGVGVGWDFSTLDDKQIAKVINKPWSADGKNFSQRIWGNRQKLVNELNTELTRNIILGQDPQKAIDAIARKMNTSKSNAGRLVMTEEAFFGSAAQRDCFTELDVEQFEVVATLDSHTSDICQDMDGKHFPMSQWEVGTTAPPFHVRCRSTTVPYFDDDFGSVGERAARGADGKTYHVPGDMKYKDWKKAFVEGDKSGLQEITPDDTMTVEDLNAQITDLKKQFTDVTDGYSYDDWFSDFSSIEEGYGEVSDNDTSFNKLKELDQKIKNTIKKKAELEPSVTTRKQIDAGHGKVPDEELDVFNEKAYQSILEETGYSESDAQEFHKNMQYYFGGNYEAFTTGQAPKETAIIDAGLSKMQPYDGEIYRGMGFLEDAVDDYEKFRTLKVGAELPTRSCISSWTSNLESSYGFGGLPEAYRDTVLIKCVKNKTSVGVQHISKFRDVEAEVLARSDARWVVRKVTTRSSYDAYKEYLETLDGKDKDFYTNYLEDTESDFRSHLYTVIEVEEL